MVRDIGWAGGAGVDTTGGDGGRAVVRLAERVVPARVETVLTVDVQPEGGDGEHLGDDDRHPTADGALPRRLRALAHQDERQWQMTAPITTRVSSDGLVMDKVASPDLILGVIKGAHAGGTMKNIWKPRAA